MTQLQQKLWAIATQIPFECEYWLKFDKHRIGVQSDFFEQFEDYFLELGAGWGEVAIQLAKSNPTRGFVLVEKKKERLHTIYRSIQKESLNNVRLVCLNFNWFFQEVFEENLFQTVFVNFPDPWPKKRHHKHRSVNLDFIQKTHQILVDKGDFYFATDNEEYALEVVEIFDSIDLFSFQEKFSHSREGFPISHFETLQKSENKQIYYLKRTKT